MRRQLIMLTVACFVMLGGAGARAIGDTGTPGQGSQPAWASPNARALRLVGPASNVPDQPNFQSNLDCAEMTYHLTNSSSLQNGCFMSAAYGLANPDNNLVIFNGTDEGLALKSFTAHQVLTPWPGTLDVLALTTANTGGSYVGLYKNILADLQDERDISGQLNAKQITAPPDVTLTDPGGQLLVINPQTMAFSDNGSWLVVETLGGAFVRINLATLDMTSFAPSFTIQGNPALLKSQVAISENGRYVAIENTASSSFKVSDLSACSGPIDNLHPRDCPAADYWSFISDQIANISNLAHLRFVNDGLISFRAASGGNTNLYELAPADSITALIDYLGMGDSYTSGEGAFDYLTGTDTGDNVCHLSARSYPLLISTQLFGDGHSVACSGARLQDILPAQPGNYRGQVHAGLPKSQRSVDSVAQILANYTPGYLAQADFVSHYQPGIITVSVGGDDIGFGDMIQNCVEPHLSLQLSNETCYATYEGRLEVKNLIDRTVPKWITLYRHLQAKSPGSRLYVVGYPQIATDTGDCALNVHLSKSELEFSEELVSYLDGAIQEAAANAGVQYVDISQALAGHRLCETAGYDVAVNGLTAGTDGGPFGLKIFGKESYHPNALGQALIANLILSQTHNLRSTTVAAAPGTNISQTLLNVPRSNRPINNLIPEPNMISRVINNGAATLLQIDGASDALRPGDIYTVRLDGALGSTVSLLSADQTGALVGLITLPQNTTPGGHTINVTGENLAGEPVDITQPIYVPASSTDADGDGLPDGNDSCPGTVNSGVNADHDGVDDSCDPVIGSANSGGQANGNGSDALSLVYPPDPGNNFSPQPNGPTADISGGDPASGQDWNAGLDIAAFFDGDYQTAGYAVPLPNMLPEMLGGQNPPGHGSTFFKPSGGQVTDHRKRLSAGGQPANTSPRIIHWLPWMSLLVSLVLLLILAGWCAERLGRLRESAM